MVLPPDDIFFRAFLNRCGNCPSSWRSLKRAIWIMLRQDLGSDRLVSAMPAKMLSMHIAEYFVPQALRN